MNCQIRQALRDHFRAQRGGVSPAPVRSSMKLKKSGNPVNLSRSRPDGRVQQPWLWLEFELRRRQIILHFILHSATCCSEATQVTLI